MSQQILDLRRSIKIVRRQKVLVGVAAALGLFVGVGYAVLNPAKLTSTALVMLPSAPQNTAGIAVNSPGSYMATQVVVADSNRVLADALPDVRPAMSLDELRSNIQVGVPTSYVISVSASGRVAADTEASANAVADSYVAYVTDPNNQLGNVQAFILQRATGATGRGPLEMLVIYGVIGAVAGALIGVGALLAVKRKDKRLRERDEIANSIGIPVLASIPVAHPSDAAGWTSLLQDYKPEAIYAWRLRKALQQLTMLDEILKSGPDGGGSTLIVLSLSSDSGALALGPQLAVFAASLGIPTALVMGQQQDPNVTAALRTACATLPAPTSFSRRSSQLHVTVSEGGNFQVPRGTVLTVLVATVDGHTPQMPDTMPSAAAVLGVSSGSATAEQLARIAVSAAVDGREIVGILVADPDPTDITTGQVPQLAPLIRHRLPTRLTGMTTEIRK